MTNEEIKNKIKKQLIEDAESLANLCIDCAEKGTGYDAFFISLRDIGEHICNIVEWDMYSDKYGGPDSWE